MTKRRNRTVSGVSMTALIVALLFGGQSRSKVAAYPEGTTGTHRSEGPAHEGQATPRTFPDFQGRSVGIEYYRFVLIRHDDHLIALHVMPDPRHGWDGISYRWYHLANGKDDFFRPSPEEADSVPNPNLESGSGEAHENEEGTGEVHAGPLTIRWSKGGLRTGWLYLDKTAEVVQVYTEQFDRIDEFSGKLDPRRWKRAH